MDWLLIGKVLVRWLVAALVARWVWLWWKV
jgi:hypothetical protein